MTDSYELGTASSARWALADRLPPDVTSAARRVHRWTFARQIRSESVAPPRRACRHLQSPPRQELARAPRNRRQEAGSDPAPHPAPLRGVPASLTGRNAATCKATQPNSGLSRWRASQQAHHRHRPHLCEPPGGFRRQRIDCGHRPLGLSSARIGKRPRSEPSSPSGRA